MQIEQAYYDYERKTPAHFDAMENATKVIRDLKPVKFEGMLE